ncbi:hypothetical protein P9850_12640 [Anoxybacillus rupiensis]|uniref:Sporulation protein Cse60 n=1 Tax=Anoxybacteroides rupiense TaxID=311460 RepID=A0ABD5IWE5_9BACL|nr:hypothetical protein [Anoxybacillus rupiensis]
MKIVYVDTAAENEALSVAQNYIRNAYGIEEIDMYKQEIEYPLERYHLIGFCKETYYHKFLVDSIDMGQGKVKIIVSKL